MENIAKKYSDSKEVNVKEQTEKTPTKEMFSPIKCEQNSSSEEEFLAQIFDCQSSSPNKPSFKRHPLEGMFQDSESKSESGIEMSDDEVLETFITNYPNENLIDMPNDVVLESFILENTI